MKKSLKQLAAWLQIENQQFPDTVVTGVSIDTRTIQQGDLFIPFRGEAVNGHRFVEQAFEKGAAASLWMNDEPNPPANLPLIFVDDPEQALQQMARAYRKEHQATFIGITGSNGKTSSKDILAGTLSPYYKVQKTIGNFNNQLGLPITILQLDEDTEVSVLEMGMSGYGEIEFLTKLARPHYTIITNIGEAHMRDLGSREGIAKAKFEIIQGLSEDGILFFDEEHPVQSCSGFVCFNEKGEVLFGRNFDGAGGPLCLISNSANGYRYLQFTAPNYNSAIYNGYARGDAVNGDGILSDGKTSLHRLLRQPMAMMDGMNEYGLCFGAFQLSEFATDENPDGPIRVMQKEDGKDFVANSLMQNLILNRCKTVKEVENMMRSYNFLSLHPSINVHWMVADATGDYAVFEYWEDKLYVLRPEERSWIAYSTSQIVPYEYNSIENYYCNPEATATYMQDEWQYGYSSKVRVGHLMNAYASKVRTEFIGGQYKPVMTEMEALECLQAGSFAIESYGNATNWSCVYNPAQKTILFNMRNDMSQIYKIDFDADFR